MVAVARNLSVSSFQLFQSLNTGYVCLNTGYMCVCLSVLSDLEDQDQQASTCWARIELT